MEVSGLGFISPEQGVGVSMQGSSRPVQVVLGAARSVLAAGEEGEERAVEEELGLAPEGSRVACGAAAVAAGRLVRAGQDGAPWRTAEVAVARAVRRARACGRNACGAARRFEVSPPVLVPGVLGVGRARPRATRPLPSTEDGLGRVDLDGLAPAAARAAQLHIDRAAVPLPVGSPAAGPPLDTLVAPEIVAAAHRPAAAAVPSTPQHPAAPPGLRRVLPARGPGLAARTHRGRVGLKTHAAALVDRGAARLRRRVPLPLRPHPARQPATATPAVPLTLHLLLLAHHGDRREGGAEAAAVVAALVGVDLEVVAACERKGMVGARPVERGEAWRGVPLGVRPRQVVAPRPPPTSPLAPPPALKLQNLPYPPPPLLLLLPPPTPPPPPPLPLVLSPSL
ncbi:hypothetical protein FIBSPDRAFT_900545 [Athelia psychrophila]|uniref:Uncharacterized protein n=1 Tax=Athelia psychrophila TaxID=1759441 RepID=A0A165YB45_9AGAM|nr:hypothetical protein FIBSPDRAFT_900545 [Fibularhizoctonia sp. CBS 109695]